MKVIFFGLGSIGIGHAKLLSEHFDCQLYAFRTWHGMEERNSEKVKELSSWKEVEKVNPDVAFITNPTYLHIQTAIECAKRDMHLFIEKPVDCGTRNLDELLELVSKRHLTTYVAFNLRFHPVIKKIRECQESSDFSINHLRVSATSYLPLWRPKQDVHRSYSAHSSMGGGIILDFFHEIDYAGYILGEIKEIKGSFGRKGNVTVDAEDYADLLLQTETGSANIHINSSSHFYQRIIQIDLDEKTIVGDLLGNWIKEFEKKKEIESVSFDIEYNQTYLEQLKYFLDNIENGSMMNNIYEAAELFRKVIEFKNNGYYGR